MDTKQDTHPIIPAVSTRRTYSSTFKYQVVQESLGSESVSGVARWHNINANQVFKWRRLYREGLLEVPAGYPELLPVTITETPQDLSASGAGVAFANSPETIVNTLAGGHRVVKAFNMIKIIGTGFISSPAVFAVSALVFATKKNFPPARCLNNFHGHSY